MIIITIILMIFNALDYNIKQKLSEKINFENKYSRKIYLELCNLISYEIDNVSKTFEILNENDINIILNQIKKIWKKVFKNYLEYQKINFYLLHLNVGVTGPYIYNNHFMSLL